MDAKYELEILKRYVGGLVLKLSSDETRRSSLASQKTSRWVEFMAMTDSKGAFPDSTMVRGRVIRAVPFQYVR